MGATPVPGWHDANQGSLGGLILNASGLSRGDLRRGCREAVVERRKEALSTDFTAQNASIALIEESLDIHGYPRMVLLRQD